MRLNTTYMGFKLKNPLVPSASPLTMDLDKVKALEDNGASALVMYSLFEEQIKHDRDHMDHFMDLNTNSFAESLSFFPEPDEFSTGPDEYLEHLRKIKESVSIPVFASLNGETESGWTDYAAKLEEAGADGLELNIHFMPVSFEENSASVEGRYIDIVRSVKDQVNIPIAVKIGSRFSALPAFAKSLAHVGADALVLFNRFYHPEINLEKLELETAMRPTVSADIRRSMRWIAILRGNVDVSFAATSGVHSAEDVLKLVMSGADVTQLATALMRHGPGLLRKIENDIVAWMDANEYQDLEQMKGSMCMQHIPNPQTLVRANYMRTLLDYRMETWK
jgi:dihydroorotate dehydrogenase (fumarate)